MTKIRKRKTFTVPAWVFTSQSPVLGKIEVHAYLDEDPAIRHWVHLRGRFFGVSNIKRVPTAIVVDQSAR